MGRTEVGYGGGSKDSPTYHDLGSHAEVLQIEFDPKVIAFDDLLERFWSGHDPRRRDRSSQYRAILLCEDDDQFARVNRRIERMESSGLGAVGTEVTLGKPFYPAEGYHQKWKLRQKRELFAALARDYESEAELLRSRAATKLNALVAGHLTAAQLERELGQLGLSNEAMVALHPHLPRRLRAG